MSQVIFVRTRHEYGSYVDFFRLAELSGYPIIYVDEMLQHDSKDTTFIISPVNGEWNMRPRGYTQGRVILWMLEWNIDDEHNPPDSADEIWNSDKRHSDIYGFKYVPMGSHSGLNQCPDIWPLRRNDDVALLSYQTPRRQVVQVQLEDRGLKLAPISNQWGTARSTTLLSSKLMLHIHQREDTKGIAPLRWCLAAAHKLPLITEQVPDAGIFDARYMMQARYETIASFTSEIVKEWRILQEYSEALYQLLCVDYTFKRSVESHV
jgi:hypothetical protein